MAWGAEQTEAVDMANATTPNGGSTHNPSAGEGTHFQVKRDDGGNDRWRIYVLGSTDGSRMDVAPVWNALLESTDTVKTIPPWVLYGLKFFEVWIDNGEASGSETDTITTDHYWAFDGASL